MSSSRHARRVFAIVAGVLFAAAALVIVLGSVLPRHWRVQRSVAIVAAPADVFAFVGDLDHWDEWAQSDRAGLAPSHRVSQPSAGPGATLGWYEANGIAGEVRIVESDPARGVVFESRIGDGEPSRISLTWTESGGLTLVTWTDEGRLPPIIGSLARSAFQERLGAHLEAGLQRLRERMKEVRGSAVR